MEQRQELKREKKENKRLAADTGKENSLNKREREEEEAAAAATPHSIPHVGCLSVSYPWPSRFIFFFFFLNLFPPP